MNHNEALRKALPIVATSCPCSRLLSGTYLCRCRSTWLLVYARVCDFTYARVYSWNFVCTFGVRHVVASRGRSRINSGGADEPVRNKGQPGAQLEHACLTRGACVREGINAFKRRHSCPLRLRALDEEPQQTVAKSDLKCWGLRSEVALLSENASSHNIQSCSRRIGRFGKAGSTLSLCHQAQGRC